MKKLHERIAMTIPVPMLQSNGVLSKSYYNFMSEAFLWVQIRDSMSSPKNYPEKS